jgi:hypothetical protein
LPAVSFSFVVLKFELDERRLESLQFKCLWLLLLIEDATRGEKDEQEDTIKMKNPIAAILNDRIVWME